MGKNKPLSRRYAKWGYIFSIPFILAFLVFHAYPLFRTLILAFTELRGAAKTDFKWLWDAGKPWYFNFLYILKSQMFHKALKNTLFFWICEAIPEWILAFWLAAVVTDRRYKIKGKTFFKTAFFMPKVLSGYIMGLFFVGLFSTFFAKLEEFVLIASAIDGFGFTPEDFEFIWSLPFFIIVINIYMHFGIIFVYAVAGMGTIPTEVFEAAEMDGANRIQTFFRVTLPGMRPVLFFISVITIMDGLGMFDVPYVFGFWDNSNPNITLMMYIYILAFRGTYNYAMASAASVILLIMFGAISIFAGYILRDKDEAKLKAMRRLERREERRAQRQMAKGEVV